MAFPLMTGFLFSALTLPWTLLGRVDLVVEVDEGVADGSNAHNIARIEGSSGALVPGCPVWPNPFPPVFSMRVRAEAGTAAVCTGRTGELLFLSGVFIMSYCGPFLNWTC